MPVYLDNPKNGTYVDWQEMYNSIRQQSKVLEDSCDEERLIQDGYLILQPGSRITISASELASLQAIRLMWDYRSAADVSTNTIVTVTGNNIEFPMILDSNYQQIHPQEISDVGNSLVFLAPQAQTVKIGKDNTAFLGHLVAPNADISIPSGSYNGTIIGKSFDSGSAEGHMYWYAGGSLTYLYSGSLSFEKTVDGKTPVDERFTFRLYKQVNNGSQTEWEFLEDATTTDGVTYFFETSDLNTTEPVILKIEESVPDGYVNDHPIIYVKGTPVSSIKQGANPGDHIVDVRMEYSFYEDESLTQRMDRPVFNNETVKPTEPADPEGPQQPEEPVNPEQPQEPDTPSSIEVKLEGKKILKNHLGDEIPVEDDSFTFILFNQDETVKKKVKNKGDWIVFDSLLLEEGTHYFTIEEEPGIQEGIFYDSHKVEVVIDVKLVGNELIPTVTYDDKETFEFVNKKLQTSITPVITKTLMGLDGSSYNKTFPIS